ncbi:MAG: hypothetical protein QOC92_3821 [Acidimicrobiaceae bacterium]
MPYTFQLTPAQARFADAHESYEHLRAAHGGVFIYREQGMRTERWLVAPDGTELDCARMHRTPAEFR